ncbi:MAG: hypothetical protein ACKOFI_01405 [Phycisphaerales bacterium]
MHLSDALRPAVILDACAGRGTKTGQLAELHPQAEVVATDVDGARLRALAASCTRAPGCAASAATSDSWPSVLTW